MTLAKKVKKPSFKKPATFTYQVLTYSQRKSDDAPRFAIFHAPVREILSWATIDRLDPRNRKGAQRPLRELKRNKVTHFFEKDKRNTIPTAVVVSLSTDAAVLQVKPDSGKQGQHGTITISVKDAHEKPGLIIDGQHRVYGAFGYRENMHLSIVAFLGNDDDERAFQFVVINNSATKVSKDHIRALNLSYKQETLNNRLINSAGLSLGMSDESFKDFKVVDGREPFKGLLKWPTNKDGFIVPNAVDSALAVVKDKASLLGIEELEVEFFLDVWNRINHLRADVWNADSHLLEKVGMHALTSYIVENLEVAARLQPDDDPLDFTNIATLHKYVDRVVERIPEDFWTAEWLAKGLDTGAGRQLLLDALKTIDINQRQHDPWYEGVSLVDASVYAIKPALKAAKAAAKKLAKVAAKKK